MMNVICRWHMNKQHLAIFSMKGQLYMYRSSVTSDHEQGVTDDIKKSSLNYLTGIFCRSVYFIDLFH